MRVLEILSKAWFEMRNLTDAMRPKITGVIYYSSLSMMFRGMNPKYYEVTDEYYKTISLASVQKFLKYNVGRIKKYERMGFDCENYADVLRGLAQLLIPGVPLGVVRVNRRREKDKHALNFVIILDEDKRPVWLYIEPQSNSMFNLSMGRAKGYEPYFIYV